MDSSGRLSTAAEEFKPWLDILNEVLTQVPKGHKQPGDKWREEVVTTFKSDFIPLAVATDFQVNKVVSSRYGELWQIAFKSQPTKCRAAGEPASTLTLSFSGFATVVPGQHIAIHSMWDFRATRTLPDGRKDTFRHESMLFKLGPDQRTPEVPFSIYPELKPVGGIITNLAKNHGSPESPPLWVAQATLLSRINYACTTVTAERKVNIVAITAVGIVLGADSVCDFVTDIWDGKIDGNGWSLASWGGGVIGGWLGDAEKGRDMARIIRGVAGTAITGGTFGLVPGAVGTAADWLGVAGAAADVISVGVELAEYQEDTKKVAETTALVTENLVRARSRASTAEKSQDARVNSTEDTSRYRRRVSRGWRSGREDAAHHPAIGGVGTSSSSLYKKQIDDIRKLCQQTRSEIGSRQVVPGGRQLDEIWKLARELTADGFNLADALAAGDGGRYNAGVDSFNAKYQQFWSLIESSGFSSDIQAAMQKAGYSGSATDPRQISLQRLDNKTSLNGDPGFRAELQGLRGDVMQIFDTTKPYD